MLRLPASFLSINGNVYVISEESKALICKQGILYGHNACHHGVKRTFPAVHVHVVATCNLLSSSSNV